MLPSVSARTLCLASSSGLQLVWAQRGRKRGKNKTFWRSFFRAAFQVTERLEEATWCQALKGKRV